MFPCVSMFFPCFHLFFPVFFTFFLAPGETFFQYVSYLASKKRILLKCILDAKWFFDAAIIKYYTSVSSDVKTLPAAAFLYVHTYMFFYYANFLFFSGMRLYMKTSSACVILPCGEVSYIAGYNI